MSARDFWLAPFRGIKSMWSDGPEGQWLAIFATGISSFGIAAIVILATVIVKDEMAHFRYERENVSSGIVVYKYVTEQRRSLVGKVIVTIPARCHIVIRGKDRQGVVRDRDVVVYPQDFDGMEEGSTQSFAP